MPVACIVVGKRAVPSHVQCSANMARARHPGGRKGDVDRSFLTGTDAAGADARNHDVYERLTLADAFDTPAKFNRTSRLVHSCRGVWASWHRPSHRRTTARR